MEAFQKSSWIRANHSTGNLYIQISKSQQMFWTVSSGGDKFQFENIPKSVPKADIQLERYKYIVPIGWHTNCDDYLAKPIASVHCPAANPRTTIGVLVLIKPERTRHFADASQELLGFSNRSIEQIVRLLLRRSRIVRFAV